MNYRRIEQIAANVYKECDIRSFPIDCEKILTHFGIRTINIDTLKETQPELYLLCLDFSEDAFLFREKKLIFYRNVNHRRTRFSLMHELGHLLLDHSFGTPQDETEANYFASYMLAPRPLLRYAGRPDIRQFSDCFDISREAARVVIDDYYRWWRRHRDYPEWEQQLVERYMEHRNPYLCQCLARENDRWLISRTCEESRRMQRAAGDGFIPCPEGFEWENL